MKKLLKKQNREVFYYKDGKKIIIDRDDKSTYPSRLYGKISPELSGDVSGLSGNILPEFYGNILPELYGNISSLYGNISGLYGNISPGLSGDVSELYGKILPELYGNISGLYGNISRLSGNIDDCEITNEERSKGIDIEDLII